MTRVFAGERTFLSPGLRPVEAGLYHVAGIDESTEQHWLAYTVAMLLFHVGGFFIIYLLMRWQAVLPFNPVPIVVLLAREREAEKIEALDLGADDYVNKPFNVGELLARMRTALRHRMRRNAEVPVLKVGGLEVDSVRHRVTRGGAELKLTPKELELLTFLAKHAGRVVTHRQILAAVWGPAHTEDTQYLRVYVGQLRQKIEEHPDDPRVILTEPGIGYRMADRQ